VVVGVVVGTSEGVVLGTSDGSVVGWDVGREVIGETVG
jgi:hypothetical protein